MAFHFTNYNILQKLTFSNLYQLACSIDSKNALERMQTKPVSLSFFNRSLVTFSDGCGGQNKNCTIISLFHDMHKRGVYDIINYKFLVRGHTFLENERDFSLIVKRKRTTEVLLPGDWTQVIREANLKKPFIATEVEQGDMKYKMGKKYQDGSQVRIREMQWMDFGCSDEEDEEGVRLVHHPNEIWIRTGFFLVRAVEKTKNQRNPDLN